MLHKVALSGSFMSIFHHIFPCFALYLRLNQTGFYKLFVRTMVVFLLPNSRCWLAIGSPLEHILKKMLNTAKMARKSSLAFSGHFRALFAPSGVNVGPKMFTWWWAQKGVSCSLYAHVFSESIRTLLPC